MELSLLISGGIFALVFVLYSLVQTARGRLQVSFWGMVLAFLATLLPVGAIIANQMSPTRLLFIDVAAVGIAVVVILFSGIILFIEHRRSANASNSAGASRGVLGIGMGTVVIVAALVVPFTMGMMTPAQAQVELPATVAAQVPDGVQVAAAAVEQEVVAQQATREPAQPTPTPSRTPQPLPQLPTIPPALLTIPAIDATEEATVESTADAVVITSTDEALANAECLGTVTQGLNVRAFANLESRIIRTIPADAVIPIFGQSRGGFWLSTEYEDTPGWVSSQYIALSADCGELPELPSN